MSEKRNVDPRFPAVFQRGYAGGGDATVLREPVAREPVARDEIGVPPAAPADRAAPPSERAEPPLEHDEPRRNPFVVLLWVVSVALSFGGVWIVLWSQIRQADFNYAGSQVPFEFVLFQMAYLVCGPAITAGLIGIIGLLFWHAAAWRRRAIAASRHPEH